MLLQRQEAAATEHAQRLIQAMKAKLHGVPAYHTEGSCSSRHCTRTKLLLLTESMGRAVAEVQRQEAAAEEHAQQLVQAVKAYQAMLTKSLRAAEDGMEVHSRAAPLVLPSALGSASLVHYVKYDFTLEPHATHTTHTHGGLPTLPHAKSRRLTFFCSAVSTYE